MRIEDSEIQCIPGAFERVVLSDVDGGGSGGHFEGSVDEAEDLVGRDVACQGEVRELSGCRLALFLKW